MKLAVSAFIIACSTIFNLWVIALFLFFLLTMFTHNCDADFAVSYLSNTYIAYGFQMFCCAIFFPALMATSIIYKYGSGIKGEGGR